MKKKLKQTVIEKMMDRAIQINGLSQNPCRDFSVMASPVHKDTLILRWTNIDISDLDNPKQCYYYECFYLDGTPHNCSIHYSNQEEANEFFWGLKTLYKQDFSIDHKTNNACTK